MEGDLQLRLNAKNSEKIRGLMTDLDMSASQIGNLVLDAVSALEIRQVITFMVEVKDSSGNPPRRKYVRRENKFMKGFHR